MLVYQFSDDDLNSNQFFRFSKKWVDEMNWSLLSSSAKAVVPVIYAFDNGKGESWPSELTIGALSGLSRKTVRKGITDLLRQFPGFSFTWQMTSDGRKSKRFKFTVPGNDRAFFFYKIVLTGGNWRLLKPVAKAVYPVLRAFSSWDKEEAEEEEGGIIDNADGDYKAAYGEREFDYSRAEPGVIRQRVFPALRDLQEHFLIERAEGRWKVFLKPPYHYKRAGLNQQLMTSFKADLAGRDED
jgi:hypothetical protein